MYSYLRKFLFYFNPERSHTIALQGLRFADKLGLLRLVTKPTAHPRTVMGLTFQHPVGLAAGLDKNADYVDALAALGFSFIEIGTVTPKPQTGNMPPRLFRLVEQEALINRMGFNNKGMEYVAHQLEKTRYRGILGINIGKNKDTPLEHAADDYRLGFRHLWKYASYITINISSPNTPGLRDLQEANALTALLATLKKEQGKIAEIHRYIPLVVKISPDLSHEALRTMATILLQQKIDGVIATNTTIQREGIEQSPVAHEAGGLSGRPLQARSTYVIKQLHPLLQNNIPIIASGGVIDKASIQEKLAAGASLVQVYTGLIYHGLEIMNDTSK
ncbi:MAG: dihydroorotate dehydrogenase (quinone) [Gammaproteobacteria bacterium RIFCSPHIGHO2_12_FULL_37_34]|nr:MAG: dihydroorotate dehydrogenase (quinone) [Gammaproteobacteria bacterium RIFCSPHIGHO2_12_FULL_37_34]